MHPLPELASPRLGSVTRTKEPVLNCESFCDLLCPQISVIGNCSIPAAKGEVPEIEPDHAV